MGAYVSKAQCESDWNIKLDCVVAPADDTGHLVIGGLQYGKFEGNPDIAGVGVFYVFFSIAATALVISLLYLLLQCLKYIPFTGIERIHQMQEHEKEKETISNRIAWSDVIEAIIMSCSDQQIFTSAAYAITLKYAQGCSISAYHYNIVGNMMLMTCATHLMSVTVVSQYWKHPLLAIVRILVVTGLYIATGLLLSNQNASQTPRWPTDVPKGDETDSLLVLPAACFQPDSAGALNETLSQSFESAHAFFDSTLLKSTPNNKIVGWNFFILMVLWYGFAIIAEVFRLWYHRRKHVVHHLRGQRKGLARWAYYAFWFYQFAGAAFCTIAVGFSFNYIRRLRNWMSESGWMERDKVGRDLESDSTTFGQLVPIFLTLLTLFAFCQMLGDKISERRHRGKPVDAEAAAHAALTHNGTPSLPSSSIPVKKDNFTVTVASAPITPTLQIDEPQLMSSPGLQQRPPLAMGNVSSPSMTASHASNSPPLPSPASPAAQNRASGYRPS